MAEEKLELQFERAELDQPSTAPGAAPTGAVSRIACAACGNNVRSYFSVNGRSLCRRCHDEAVADHRGLAPVALAKALGLGLVAAALGAIVYYGVAKITGYEIGLVAIVVGLLVGGAVKLGSGGRGGRRYQALAVALCYLAIAMSYGAFVVEELGKDEKAAGAAAAPGVQPASLATGGDAQAEALPTAEDSDGPGGAAIVGELLLLLVKLPVLVGMESPMTFLLIAIALWEAWKLNVGQPFVASGPFAVGEASPAAG
jgi:hypothetical protein